MQEMEEMRLPSLGREDPLEEEETATPLQYSCLENSMDRGAWRAIVHGNRKESDTTECGTASAVEKETGSAESRIVTEDRLAGVMCPPPQAGGAHVCQDGSPDSTSETSGGRSPAQTHRVSLEGTGVRFHECVFAEPLGDFRGCWLQRGGLCP